MGNCLVLQEKTVRVMKSDGKIIEYKSPVKVHQLLSEFPNHAIYDGLPVVKHLHPDAEMIRGRLYHLLPMTVSCQPTKKKKVSFSDDPLEEAGKSTGVVRINVVIRKQELQAMLEGEISVENMIPEVYKIKTASTGKDWNLSCTGWLPALDSIPEGNEGTRFLPLV